MNAYFMGSVLLLALLLFFPVSRLVWALSVRRFQRKANRTLSEVEIQGQLNRARVISAILVLVFSCLFNAQLSSHLGYG